jgi:hypothetical protein
VALADDFSATEPLLDATPTSQPPRTARRWLERLISPGSNQLTGLGHGVLAGALLLGSFALNGWMLVFASHQERDWLNFATVEKTLEASKAAVANVQATPAERARMVDQFMLIQARTQTHAEVMGLFYKLNFIALGTIGLATGVASISLFFISKAGWERANNALINIFIVSTGLVIFHSNVIFIFKFQDNIKLNGELYTEYTQLYNSVLSYWAIQPSSANSPNPAEFILATDQQLATLGKVTLDFDVSRISQLSKPLEPFTSPGGSSGK